MFFLSWLDTSHWGVSHLISKTTQLKRYAQTAVLLLKPSRCTLKNCSILAIWLRLVKDQAERFFYPQTSQKKVSQSAKPSRQREHLQVEPFTVLRLDPFLAIYKQFTGACKLSAAPLHNPSSGQTTDDLHCLLIEIQQLSRHSYIPKKFSIPKVTSHSQNLKISEDIREDTALEQRLKIHYSRRPDLFLSILLMIKL